MISQEQFVERVLDEFDYVKQEIANIKKDVSTLQETVNTHLAVGEALQDEKSKTKEVSDRRWKIGIIGFGIILTIYEIVSNIN